MRMTGLVIIAIGVIIIYTAVKDTYAQIGQHIKYTFTGVPKK